MDAAVASPSLRHYSWAYVLGLFRRQARRIAIANLVAAGAAVLSVPIPLLLPLLVDEVLLGHGGPLSSHIKAFLPPAWHGPTAIVLVVVLVTVVLRLGASALQVWQMRAFALVAKDLIFNIRRELLERLAQVSMAEYEALGASTVSSHLIVDLNTVDEFTGKTLSQLVVAVLTLIGAAAVLLWMHWPLGVFILVMNPLAVWTTVLISRRVKALKRRENAAVQSFQESLAETLDTIHQLRAANRERHFLGRAIELARGIRDHAAAFAWKSDAADRMSYLVFLVGVDLFRAFAMLLVVYSDLSLGRMIAVFGYLWYMVQPIETLLGLQFAYRGASAALERINDVWRLAAEPQYPALADPFAGRRTNGVVLDGVTFRYGQGAAVLDHFSLGVAPGEQVALVGASGGGKSTLVQIMLGLYTPSAGTVSYDGVPLEHIGLGRVREHVGVVLQHPALLNATVRENLTLGVAASDDALWRALGIAQLADVVAGLPQGLDTVVGRSGIRLSGGQRQRLAIARMLLKDPNVVVLDEATSALDAITEARLYAALHEHLAGRTMIIIAHRLSAVAHATRICVIEHGRVVEQGGHAALLARGGVYAQLYGQSTAH